MTTSRSFRAAIGAEEEVTTEVQLLGDVGDDAVLLGHRVLIGDKVCATAKTVRRLIGVPRDAWRGAFSG